MSRTHNEVTGAVHGIVIQANTVSLGSSLPPRRPVWMVPEPTRELVDRDEITQRAATLLRSGHRTIGLVGGGGFGKTTLAAQVCHLTRSAFPGGVLWVTLGEHVPDLALADKINDLSELLCGHRPALTDPQVAGHRLADLCNDRLPTLLVVDDVWSSTRLAPFRVAGMSIMATSRSRGALPQNADILAVGAMSPAESRSLLTTGLPGTQTKRLERLTGRWPLLLALVNSAIRRAVADGVMSTAAADMIADDLLADGPNSLDLDSADSRDQAVRRTVEASLIPLGDAGRDQFHRVGVFPEDIDIPIDILGLLWPELNQSDRRRLIRSLVDRSLLTRTGGNSVRLHDVLRTYLRRTLRPGQLAKLNADLTEILRNAASKIWTDSHPYTLRYLAWHAADAGQLDGLLSDAAFLLAAEQPELMVSLSVTNEIAGVYRRVAHHLRDRPAAERAAYLDLAARKAEVTLDVDTCETPWRCSWTQWDVEPQHIVLARHGFAVDQVELAQLSDGRVWAITVAGGSSLIVDVSSNESHRPSWSEHPTSAMHIVPMPDGRILAYLVAWNPDSEFQVWDVETETRVPMMFRIDPTFRPLTSTPTASGPVVVGMKVDSDAHSTIEAFDADTGTPVGVPIALPAVQENWQIAAGLWSNGNPAVAAFGDSEPIRVWDLITGERLGSGISQAPRGPRGTSWRQVVPFRDILSDGIALAGDREGALRISADDILPLIGPVRVHDGEICSVSYARLPDGRVLVATGGYDHTARLWDAEVLRRTPGTSRMSPVRSVFRCGEHVVTNHKDGWWMWASGKVVSRGQGEAVACANEFILVRDCLGQVRVHHCELARTTVLLAGLQPHKAVCGELPDGRSVAVGCNGPGRLTAWDVRTGEVMWQTARPIDTNNPQAEESLPTVATVAMSVTLLATGRAVVLGGDSDGLIRVRDLATGADIGSPMACADHPLNLLTEVAAVACTRLPDGRDVAVSVHNSLYVYQSTMIMWDIATQERLATSWIPVDGIHDVVCATLPDGTPVAVTADTILQVWSLTNLPEPWEPYLDIDLDSLPTCMTVDHNGALVVGTWRGLAGLRLRVQVKRPGRWAFLTDAGIVPDTKTNQTASS